MAGCYAAARSTPIVKQISVGVVVECATNPSNYMLRCGGTPDGSPQTNESGARQVATNLCTKAATSRVASCCRTQPMISERDPTYRGFGAEGAASYRLGLESLGPTAYSRLSVVLHVAT